MDNHLFQPIVLHSIITIFFFLIVVPVSFSDNNEQYLNCSRPYPDSCGTSDTLNISYPLWGDSRPRYCGREGFEIKCRNNQYHVIESGTQTFRVLSKKELNTIMTIVREDLYSDICPGVFEEIILDGTVFKYGKNVRNLSLFYDCSDGDFLQGANYVNCSVDGYTGFYTIDVEELQLPNLTDTCIKGINVSVQMDAFRDLRIGNLAQALKRGFDVELNIDNRLCDRCLVSGGVCGSNISNSEQFVCLCRDEEPQRRSCRPAPPTAPHPAPALHHAGETNRISRVKLLVGIVTAVGGLMVVCIIICIFKWKKNSSIIRTVMFWKKTKNDRHLEAFIRNYGSLAPKRYSFSNVKKMTNSFKNKLGQGGYGGVYKGKLQDGQLVAVKLLNTSKGNGQEFINEVATISRTSHVNVVMLLGFCLEGNKRALIYEFMPNGSLEKFIHGNNTLKVNGHLGWEKLYQIALGIARGLEYLHRGCSTRILHFDIKPHNILLDEDFFPKISDFGLAKLCPKKESIVSMLEARGTIGYIAPEIFNRNFGEVSHKSDVYSYGMMVLEMVGGRKNLHLGMENSSEIYFPKWIYKHLKLGEEIKFQETMTSEENEITKKMIIVGLWCIQTTPPDRPSMNKVIDMLQGSIEALQIPPDPFHSSSSSRPALDDSTTISIS